MRPIELKVRNFKGVEHTVPVYIDGRFSPVKSKTHQESPLIYLWLVKYYDCNEIFSKRTIQAINSVNKKDELTGTRYSEKLKAYKSLDGFIRYFLFKDYKNEYNDISNCYTFKDGSPLSNFLIKIKTFKITTKYNKKLCLKIHREEFLQMGTQAQIFLTKNIYSIEDNLIYVKLNEKQEIGNYGRRYNLLSNIPSADRDQIDALYGVDMSAALQTICITLMEKHFDTVLPITDAYIKNKLATREAIQELMNIGLDDAKRLITSIYQGLKYIKKSYEPLKEYFDEAHLLRTQFASLIGNKDIEDDDLSEAVKYATKRTEIKLKNIKVKDYNKVDGRSKKSKLTKSERYKVEKSFMFFLWTYYERMVQNLIASKFTYPLTLHDAVYTQDEKEFNLVDIEQLEQEIYNETSIPIRLGLTKKI